MRKGAPMRRLAVGLVGVALVLGIAVSARPADRGLSERVTAMVSHVDRPVTASEWRNVGPDAIPILLEIARDDNQLRFRRLQAIGALGYFEDPSVPAFLTAFANRADAPSSLRRAAVQSLAASQGAAAVLALEASLASDDVALREVAIRALARIDDERARASLARHLDTEPEARLRPMIEGALRER